MKQLDFFMSNERSESDEDTFDISKAHLYLEPDTIQKKLMLQNMSKIKELPSDTYIMHKTGAMHRDTTKYFEPIYPYLYDYDSNRQVAVRLTRGIYPAINIPRRFLDKGVGCITLTFHRLIAMCFLHNDNPSSKITVDHIDGDPQNYTLSNLEWVTSSENQIRKGYKR